MKLLIMMDEKDRQNLQNLMFNTIMAGPWKQKAKI
jgi:hypothetical protein